MKGRNSFTKTEVAILLQLFREKDYANSVEQKIIRDKIRKIGFYITDFAPSMNYKDFKNLLNSGKINIQDSEPSIHSKSSSKTLEKNNTIKQNVVILNEIETDVVSSDNFKKGLEPWIDAQSEILIPDSLSSDVSIKEQTYYQNKSRNSFWKLMHGLFGDGKRKGQMSESEIMTIMICRQIGTCCIFFFENKPQALPVDVEKTRPLEILLVGLIPNLSTI